MDTTTEVTTYAQLTDVLDPVQAAHDLMTTWKDGTDTQREEAAQEIAARLLDNLDATLEPHGISMHGTSGIAAADHPEYDWEQIKDEVREATAADDLTWIGDIMTAHGILE